MARHPSLSRYSRRSKIPNSVDEDVPLGKTDMDDVLGASDPVHRHRPINSDRDPPYHRYYDTCATCTPSSCHGSRPVSHEFGPFSQNSKQLLHVMPSQRSLSACKGEQGAPITHACRPDQPNLLFTDFIPGKPSPDSAADRYRYFGECLSPIVVVGVVVRSKSCRRVHHIWGLLAI